MNAASPSARFEVHRFPGVAELTAAVAARWLSELAAPRLPGKPFTVALSGGRIATPLYRAVVAASAARRTDWTDVAFFLADERWVPLNDPESNFRLAREELFTPLNLASAQLHPLHVHEDLEFATAQAQAEVLRATSRAPTGEPIFDLILLGMGEDGHVASLFPDAPPAVVGSRAVYLAVTGPKPPPQRVTLSYAALAAARRVWVLVSGPGKAAAWTESLRPDGVTPLARVLQSRRQTVLFTDLP